MDLIDRTLDEEDSQIGVRPKMDFNYPLQNKIDSDTPQFECIDLTSPIRLYYGSDDESGEAEPNAANYVSCILIPSTCILVLILPWNPEGPLMTPKITEAVIAHGSRTFKVVLIIFQFSVSSSCRMGAKIMRISQTMQEYL